MKKHSKAMREIINKKDLIKLKNKKKAENIN